MQVDINLDPLRVRIIDFNRSVLQESPVLETVRGTPGYMPDNSKWLSGSTRWDYYSLAAMMLEAGMDLDIYFRTNSEKNIRQIVTQHMTHPHTSQYLRKIIEEVIYYKRSDEPLDHQVFEGYIKKMKFRKYAELKNT